MYSVGWAIPNCTSAGSTYAKHGGIRPWKLLLVCVQVGPSRWFFCATPSIMVAGWHFWCTIPGIPTSVRKPVGNSYLGGYLVSIQLLRELLFRVPRHVLGDYAASGFFPAPDVGISGGLAIRLLGRPLERVVARHEGSASRE